MGTLSKLCRSNALGVHSVRLLCIAAAIRILHDVSVKRECRRRGRKTRTAKESIYFDITFLKRLFPLLKVCIPRVASWEFLGSVILGCMLLLRTRLTLRMAETIGRNGKYLVQRDAKKFLFGVVDIGLLAVPGTVLHVGMHYAESMVCQQMRDNLQTALHKEYLAGNSVYVIATQRNLDNPDHRIAQDAKNFCGELAELFSSVLKPLIDVIAFSVALSKTGGYGPSFLLMSYYVFVATLLSSVLPNFADLVATSQEKEGNLKTTHNQLLQHAEEVAFYGGEELERQHADHLLKSIIKHENRIKSVKWVGGLLDALFIKYGATCVGYIVCGAVVADKIGVLSKAELAQLYLQSVQLYIPMSFAIGKLLLLRKRIGALCSSASRVGELREKLCQVASENSTVSIENFDEIENGCEIEFLNVDVTTPDGVVLIKNFNLRVSKGKHILIMGSNGSGKSALVRTLTQLWPLKQGHIRLPSKDRVLFLPQRVYLPPGTLRTQMIYPLSEIELSLRNVSDADILSYAASIGLSQVVEREGGLNAIKNWAEVLSGGERQRIALVRVLVHRPHFVFLDECTSAVSQDDELKLYVQLQKAGVTLISISHREALRSIHNTLVELSGEGYYRVSALQ